MLRNYRKIGQCFEFVGISCTANVINIIIDGFLLGTIMGEEAASALFDRSPLLTRCFHFGESSSVEEEGGPCSEDVVVGEALPLLLRDKGNGNVAWV